MPASSKAIATAFRIARDRYAASGVDVDAALEKLSGLSISIHCWQGDDVRGFEGRRAPGGGIAVTGRQPGRARTPEELRADLRMALSLIRGATA